MVANTIVTMVANTIVTMVAITIVTMVAITIVTMATVIIYLDIFFYILKIFYPILLITTRISNDF